MGSLLLKNIRKWDSPKITDCLIIDGKIAIWSPKQKNQNSIDCTGYIALPSGIDPHVHFRTPGQEEKEDWHTGSQAALQGGVTTVFDMPNNTISIDTVQKLQAKKAIIKKSAQIHYALYIGATNTNLEEVKKADGKAIGVKVYYGASTGDLLLDNDEALKALFEANLQMPIVLHAEKDSIITAQAKKLKKYTGKDIHGKIRNREAAIRALKTILPLIKKTGAKVHVTHMSTAEELNLVRQAKKDALNITCDVTPHHLTFTEEDVLKQGFRLKVNPPIRTRKDVEALWRGIQDGTIDMIASDHAPHTLAEKENRDYWKVPSGVPGVEMIISVLLNKHIEKKISWNRIQQLTSKNAAKRFQFPHTDLSKGSNANMVLIDPKKKRIIERKNIRSKCRWSPWEGYKLHGSIAMTLLEGKVVFSDKKN